MYIFKKYIIACLLCSSDADKGVGFLAVAHTSLCVHISDVPEQYALA